MVDIRELVLDFYEKKAPYKTMFMFPDIYRGIKKIYSKKSGSSSFKRKDVKTILNGMVDNQEMVYWSSGSTTYMKLNKPLDELRGNNLEEKVDDST